MFPRAEEALDPEWALCVDEGSRLAYGHAVEHEKGEIMYLGIYEIDGDPDELLLAYDRLMAGMPEDQVDFHACAVRENGITIYDACPTKEAFERFSTSAEFRSAAEAAELPWPSRIEGLPLHAVRARDGVTAT